MASPLFRLSRTEFLRVFKRGRRQESVSFVMIAAPAPTLQVAVVVSKKVARSAVRRNTLKRRLYHAFLEASRVSGVEKGAYILLARPTAIEVPFPMLSTECVLMLRRAFGGPATMR